MCKCMAGSICYHIFGSLRSNLKEWQLADNDEIQIALKIGCKIVVPREHFLWTVDMVPYVPCHANFAFNDKLQKHHIFRD